MQQMNIKKRGFIIASMILLVLLILIGPADFFAHGFYCDVVEYYNIDEEGFIGYADVSQNVYETTFAPVEKHFAGFEIFFEDIPDTTDGILILSTYREDGELIESRKVNINDISSQTWYAVYTNGHYTKNTEYQLVINTENCTAPLRLTLVDNDYLSEESLGNNLLIGYAYSESTFTNAEKVLIILLLSAIWIMVFGEIFLNAPFKRKYTRLAALALGMTAILAWNYMFNSFDVENQEMFEYFQDDSDSLVTGAIEADRAGVEQVYGLGSYYVASGIYGSHTSFAYNEEWIHGYSKTEPQIKISANPYTELFAETGTIVQFENGDSFAVTEVVNSDGNYILTLNSPTPLNYYKYGDIDKASFYYLEDGIPKQYPPGQLDSYISQYGLQGKIFQEVTKFMDDEHYEENLELLCSILTAIVLCMIIILSAVKYNFLFAVCFGVTFLLSPWIVNFAGSVYWVEFTWFFPMLIGLICSIWINNRYVKVACCIAAFITIAVKSLCGYEYITTVMLGLIAFLLIDCGMAIIKKDKERKVCLLRMIFTLGVIALAAFSFAICIHALLRGEGNLLNGIKGIIKNDVLRRVGGGSMNDFDAVYWPSLNASVWEVIRRYFHFSTDIIAGLDANLFPMLCLIPIIIFIYDYIRGQINLEEVMMYVVFFVTGMSWFVLGKGHSYVHVLMNYVMWYFGFVQCCFYIIANKVRNSICGKSRKSEKI